MGKDMTWRPCFIERRTPSHTPPHPKQEPNQVFFKGCTELNYLGLVLDRGCMAGAGVGLFNLWKQMSRQLRTIALERFVRHYSKGFPMGRV